MARGFVMAWISRKLHGSRPLAQGMHDAGSTATPHGHAWGYRCTDVMQGGSIVGSEDCNGVCHAVGGALCRC